MPAAIPKGYVYVARDILKSTLWQRRPEDRVVAITAIVLANHQVAKWHDGNRDVRLDRGQFARSWDGLAARANLTPKTVRTSAQRLRTADFLGRTCTSYYSVFTVKNYGKYQDRDRYGREKEMPEGAIILARLILDSSLWRMSAQDRVVGLTCLLVANHSHGIATDADGEPLPLARGQMLATWDRLSRACQLPVEQVQESMARLISTGFIVRDPFNPSVFTIPNFNHYQDPRKYSEGTCHPFPKAVQGLLFAVPTPEAVAATPAPAPVRVSVPAKDPSPAEVPAASLLPSTPVERATTGQPPGRERAATGQGAGRERATDKNYKNDKNGEEGGRASPTPELFESGSRGAPPPLPPEALRIAQEYLTRFPRVMGRPKAEWKAAEYLERGGDPESAVSAIRQESRPSVVIWKILDPLLEKKRDWRETFVPPKEWQSAEEKSAQQNQA